MKLASVALVGTIVLLSGCEPKDREVIASEGSKAWTHATAAAVNAWTSVSKKVAEITPEASSDAMNAARSAVEAARTKLAEIPNPTPEIEKKIAAARAAIDKIDAAATLRELREKSEAMVEAARTQTENAGKSLKEIRDQLSNANENYQRIQEQMSKAQKTYEQAKDKVDNLTHGP